MSKHPINLALRFILELIALFVMGYWGWNSFNGIFQIIVSVCLPIAIAAIWGIFAVKDDPSRSGKTVVETSGVIRLFIELVIFVFACWSLYNLEEVTLSIVLLSLIIFHYVVSYDRIIWLLKHK